MDRLFEQPPGCNFVTDSRNKADTRPRGAGTFALRCHAALLTRLCVLKRSDGGERDGSGAILVTLSEDKGCKKEVGRDHGKDRG